MNIDMHTHSKYSADGNGSILDMCISALNKGINKLAITDHLDFPIKKHTKNIFNHENIYNEIKHYNNIYNNNIELLFGIEIGQPHTDIIESSNLIKKYNFDFILGSLHEFSNGQRSYLNEKLYNRDIINNHMNKYFDELTKMICNFNFNSLAHIDYVFRYTNYNCYYFNLFQYKDRLADLFKLLINKNCALEMNSKSLFDSSYKIEKNIFILYKDLGGKLLTFGSDSHTPNNIGKNINLCKQYALQCGFKYATFFKKQIPIQYKLL